MDRGAWWTTVHTVAKSQTQLKRLSTQCVIISHALLSLHKVHEIYPLNNGYIIPKDTPLNNQLEQVTSTHTTK